jgi:hypothetical protein
MEKIVTAAVIFVLGNSLVLGNNKLEKGDLQKTCLQCHQEQKIPSEMIYRRYLMRYSTPERIEKMMLAYLRRPRKEYSIMPPQFFLKFPMKQPIEMDEKVLEPYIRSYIEKFDIKKRLYLKGE